MSSPDDESPDLPVDPEEQAFVRALLGEVGREPAPLPDDVAARLDDRLAGLVAERAAGDTDRSPHPAVVPLDEARRRRRRGLTVLVAAAAVVVGGYSVTESGLLTGGADSGSADAGGASALQDRAGGASGSGGALPGDGAFPLASGSLRSDARALVDSDPDRLDLLSDSASRLHEGEPAVPQGVTPSDEYDSGADSGAGSKAGGLPAPSRAPATRCLDPLVPARLTRLAVTYDGAAATAVLRPVRPAESGAGRVRVEVWDCATPRRLAVVVVRR